MAVYKWKDGTRMAVSAQDAGEVCSQLESEGRLTRANLVEVSRPEDAPLHKAFEWNDTVAAQRYREEQAGRIIRFVEVTTDRIEEPTRAFVSLAVATQAREYHSIEAVLETADGRRQLLAEAKSELEAFRRKYKGLQELARVFAEIERVVA